ncbi:hypothetical protein BYT27DRAFT_7200604 [Phlegmacium glaucopus]|nr:hypothetical protein BYT27DRAFT_7200604 [Phlegmacium glaucopus]
MSTLLVTGSSNRKLSTTFAYNKVVAVHEFDVAELVRDHSAGAPSQASSDASTTARETRRNISRAECCFITKRPSYTLERAHWVNAVRKDPSRKRTIEEFLKRLGVVHVRFNLNDTSNLTNLDRMLHVCFDKFGFFAVTASLATLKQLIKMVEEENRNWQNRFDQGEGYIRSFGLLRPPVVNAEYEMVVLHPEHFLPKGSDLTVYSQTNGQVYGKSYVIGHDRTLRESPGTPDSPRLPAFASEADRSGSLPLNVFLVVLNAEIKFRRYKRMALVDALSPDVQELIEQTIKLVDLIYWEPEVTSEPYHRRAVGAMEVTPRALQDQQDIDMELGIRAHVEEADEDTFRASRLPRGVRCPGVNATLEERREHGQYLISGRDFDLDSDDENLLEELGLAPDCPDCKFPESSQWGVHPHQEQVNEWRAGLQV